MGTPLNTLQHIPLTAEWTNTTQHLIFRNGIQHIVTFVILLFLLCIIVNMWLVKNSQDCPNASIKIKNLQKQFFRNKFIYIFMSLVSF